jgi:hypothetical protein
MPTISRQQRTGHRRIETVLRAVLTRLFETTESGCCELLRVKGK